MVITPENLPKHELIGLEAEVIDCTDESKIGIRGEVMDETSNMLRIGSSQVEKKSCVFRFILPDSTKVKVNGDLIDRAPEERVNMRLPSKWE